MKIGDKIICINNFYSEDELTFLKNRYYIIRDIEIYKNHTLVKVDNFYFSIEPVSDLEFGKYFQSIADFRESRINEILE